MHTPASDDPSAPPSRATVIIRLALGTAAFLVVYLLAAGPALMLAQRRIVPSETVESLFFSPYSPPGLISTLLPPLEILFHGYINLWDASPR